LNGLRFEWDIKKAARNLRKHGVSFEEAETIFFDPSVLVQPDEAHSIVEDRANALGVSNRGRLLMVVVAERGGVMRIISARRATRKEVRDYADAKSDR
jgi:hypothetical protein